MYANKCTCCWPGLRVACTRRCGRMADGNFLRHLHSIVSPRVPEVHDRREAAASKRSPRAWSARRTHSFNTLTLAGTVYIPYLTLLMNSNNIHRESEKPNHFWLEHNFRRYSTILAILSLLQTEIICPQNHVIEFATSPSLLLYYLEKFNHTQKLLNKFAMHAVISLLLQSRKFWWYRLLTSFSVYVFTVPVNLF